MPSQLRFIHNNVPAKSYKYVYYIKPIIKMKSIK